MGARIIRTAASAGALCGWLASCAARASAQETGGAPGASGSGSDSSAASRLVVKIQDKWQFLLEGTGQYAEEALFEGGTVRPTFRCDGPGPALMAVDDGSMGVRKLQIGRTSPSAASSLLDGLRPLAGGWSDSGQQSDEQEVSITNARLQVLAGNGAEGGFPTPTVHVKLSQPLPNGTTMEVPRYGETPASLVVEYDCWREGRALIELRLQVVGGNRAQGTEVCMRWAKVCEMGWRNLEIAHGTAQAFTGGVVNRDWDELMNTDGTYETVTKFSLSSAGIERLRPPTVVSNQKLLKVEIRGPFYFGDSDDETFEVTRDPVGISIVYMCESDGTAEVVMTLEKTVLSEAHKPEKTELKWRKLCGATTYRHLQIYFKSDTQKNTTQAVSNGAVLPGFMRPCARKASANAPPGGALASCEAGPGALAFEVPAKERRTSLELRVDKDASFEPPSLQPPPDLSYDRRVLQATLVQLPRSATTGKQVNNARKLVQTINVKYTCFKEGVSVVMVTLHVLAHKPIDLAWRKRCVEPKVHVGKALTAPQAIVITVFVGSIIALVCCLIFYFCGQDDRSLEYDGVPNGAGRASDLEMSGRGPGPSRFGMGSDKLDEEAEEEVVFH